MLKPNWGARMRALREERGLSQTEVGRACNVTAMSVSNWETGASTPARQRAVEFMIGAIPDWVQCEGAEALEELIDTKYELLRWLADRAADTGALLRDIEISNDAMRRLSRRAKCRLAKDALVPVDGLMALFADLERRFDAVADTLRAMEATL